MRIFHNRSEATGKFPLTQRLLLVLAIGAGWGTAAGNVSAAITAGPPFGDHMVLQREVPIPVWGWATPGETVTVTLGGESGSIQADAEGRWRLMLPAMSAGGPHEMVIRGSAEIRFQDVMLGEVWLCGGQSNMAMALWQLANPDAETAHAVYPGIRFMYPSGEHHPLPQKRLNKPAAWQPVNQQRDLSAVAYYFGRDLHQTLGVPVGLIIMGGPSRIEIWVPHTGLALVPELADWTAEARQLNTQYLDALQAHQRAGSPEGQAPVHPYMVEGSDRHALGSLYNGFIHPIAGYRIRGAIWYQGESNRGDSSQYYYNLFKAMVRGWRHAWGQGDFPFYYVQISANQSWRPPTQVPEIWEAQSALLALPNTGMAVIHDVCSDVTDLHPKEKIPVAQRLALWAYAKLYGRTDLAHAGPIYQAHAVEGSRIRIRFDYTFEGLKSRDGAPLDMFVIAGADGEFKPAQAEIDGDTVVVWSDAVPQPQHVQFAWTGDAQPNLMNGAGLPAAPFRTNRGIE